MKVFYEVHQIKKVPITNNTYKTLKTGKRVPTWTAMCRVVAKI